MDDYIIERIIDAALASADLTPIVTELSGPYRRLALNLALEELIDGYALASETGEGQLVEAVSRVITAGAEWPETTALALAAHYGYPLTVSRLIATDYLSDDDTQQRIVDAVHETIQTRNQEIYHCLIDTLAPDDPVRAELETAWAAGNVV